MNIRERFYGTKLRHTFRRNFNDTFRRNFNGFLRPAHCLFFAPGTSYRQWTVCYTCNSNSICWKQCIPTKTARKNWKIVPYVKRLSETNQRGKNGCKIRISMLIRSEKSLKPLFHLFGKATTHKPLFKNKWAKTVCCWRRRTRIFDTWPAYGAGRWMCARYTVQVALVQRRANKVATELHLRVASAQHSKQQQGEVWLCNRLRFSHSTNLTLAYSADLFHGHSLNCKYR